MNTPNTPATGGNRPKPPAHSKTLRYKPRRAVKLHRLPFVTVNRRADHPDNVVDLFDVPDLGGDYDKECHVGHLLATAYLKYLKSKDASGLTILQLIVFAVARHETPRGVVVGFFSEIDRWLTTATKRIGDNLDAVSEKDIEAQLLALSGQSRRTAKGG